MLKMLAFLFVLPSLAFANPVETTLGQVNIEKIADGLVEPWSLAFLPQGYLVTEREGNLLYFDQAGARHEITGVPEVQKGGQAGLFDVLVPKNFAETQEIYLSYAKASGEGTAIFAAKLDLQAMILREGHDIFVMNSPSRSQVHFGGRLVEASPEEIWLTLGDRGDRELAQDDKVDNGAIVSVKRDGTGRKIISKGHRNPQALALSSSGEVYETEHGAQGGDELNLIEANRNYGWPIISYGLNYDGTKIGEGTEKAGLEQPLFYWDPSIAPSGLAIHDGQGWEAARDIFFVGSLKFNHIALLREAGGFSEVGQIQTDETSRVRDVRVAPDGTVWFLSVNNGALYRISSVR